MDRLERRFFIGSALARAHGRELLARVVRKTIKAHETSTLEAAKLKTSTSVGGLETDPTPHSAPTLSQ
jgi:hypothetical protein